LESSESSAELKKENTPGFDGGELARRAETRELVASRLGQATAAASRSGGVPEERVLYHQMREASRERGKLIEYERLRGKLIRN
jgi:hypothetical protein